MTAEQKSTSLEHLKHTWNYSSPTSLYDQCIQIIVKNIQIILVCNNSTTNQISDSNDCVTSKHGKKPHKLKYSLRQNIGPLPSFVCSSLLSSYEHFYLEQINQIERQAYFTLNRAGDKQLSSSSITKENLITFYDLLMTLVADKKQTSLDSLTYRACVSKHSTLEFRLLNSNSTFESIRAEQEFHLKDSDLRLVTRYKPTLEYLDICPCSLSNKSVRLINRHLSGLKYLRLQNCCLWQSEDAKEEEDISETAVIGQELPDWITDNAVRDANGARESVEDEADDEDVDNNNNSLEHSHNEYIFDEMRRVMNNRIESEWLEETEELELEREDWGDRVKGEERFQLNKNETGNNGDEEVDEDDDENFDAYLQDYIDMYTNKKSDCMEISSGKNEAGERRRLSCGRSTFEDTRTNLQYQERSDSNKRKYQHRNTDSDHYHSTNNHCTGSASNFSTGHCFQQIQKCEKDQLLEFYENQLRLIWNYNFTSSNRCKIFSLNKSDTVRQEKNIRKIQKAIKLLRRINLQTNLPMQTWHEEEKLFSGQNHSNEDLIRNQQPGEQQKTTNALLDFIFFNPSQQNNDLCPVSAARGTEVSENNLSLIDQIRQKAKFLTDTKLIDKVSITSSNFSDSCTNLNDLNQTDSSNNSSSLQVNKTSRNKASASNRFSFMNLIQISSLISGISSPYSSLSSLSSCSNSPRFSNQTSANRPFNELTTPKSANSSIHFDRNKLSDEEDTAEALEFDTLSSCSSRTSSSSGSFSSLIVSLSSLNTTTTSASSTSTFFSTNSGSPYYGSAGLNFKSRRLLKQQRLLEKAASLSSSPINLLQAIAAKALNFKLKKSGDLQEYVAESNNMKSTCRNFDKKHKSERSRKPRLSRTKNIFNSSKIMEPNTANFHQQSDFTQPKTEPFSSKSSTEDTTSKNTKLATKYNRLLRQYRFFKSTNMNGNTKDKNERPVKLSRKKLISKCKRLKESNENDLRTTGPGQVVASDTGTGDQPQNIPAHLFSAFKYWMSKRIDLLNTKANITDQTTTQTSTNSTKNATVNNPDNEVTGKLKETHLSVSSLASTSYSDSNHENCFNPLDFSDLITYDLPPNRLRLTRKFGIETLNLSNLLHLSFRNLGVNVIDVRVLNAMLVNLSSLKFLDISNCCSGKLFEPPVKIELFRSQFSKTSSAEIRQNRNLLSQKFCLKKVNSTEMVGSLYGLLHLKTSLTSLIMSDMSVNDIQANLPYILCLSELKHLDISHCKEASSLNRFTNPSLHLAKIAHHLSKLTSLDISATNLSGPSMFNQAEEVSYIKERLYEDFKPNVIKKLIVTRQSSLAGLIFLNCERLNFLGCFCCDHSVNFRANQELIAERIASEENEQNLYTSLEVYSEKPLFVLDVLNHLFELYRDETIEDKLLGGYLIMNVMDKHLDHSRIQISGCASLFYVLKYWNENLNVHKFPYFYLKRLISTVIAGMEVHIDDSAMKRNCVLIMCRLNLPEDVLFVSDRLIKILLKIFDDFVKSEIKNPNNEGPEHFVLRTSMHLLNILACSVHGSNKSSVGQLAIPIAMDLIKSKIRFEEPDDILEVTWSFLWNITDETPQNCQIFLDECSGMEAFMECIKFDKTEIIRNMMGLLGNVAEVVHLRNRLCRSSYIDTFRKLLFHKNDGIEIPYNSAGVLVHILSDGEEAWTDCECQISLRNTVINDIKKAVDNWDLHSERNINYRSFEPILRLIDQYENPICQLWSCWALANLTTVYPDVYCPLFKRENGNEVLENLIKWSQVSVETKRYALLVLKNVSVYCKP